ncbi:MAG: 3-methyl-2-oxobutanoate hydroxymethyltransferase [Candidatus Omnitrophota bacterium]
MERKKITIPDVIKKKENNEKITVLTAYDFPTASLVDQAGIDMILVGDTVGNIVLGYDSPVPVTTEEMLHHTKAVKKGTKYALLIGDMPFMSFNVSEREAVINAGRFIKEAGADAVKLESATPIVINTVKKIVEAGIPVMGHLGLTPQTSITLGGYKVQGKSADAAKLILEQAKALEQAGCFCIVLECVPDALAEVISKNLKIPTIGIGAGAGCDGQVLVLHDMLGLTQGVVPKFVKQYADLKKVITHAVETYIAEVKEGKFPGQEHAFKMKKEEVDKMKNSV